MKAILTTETQHRVILEQLRGTPKTTFDLRDQGIVQVPVRVSELRASGFNIVSYWSEVEQDGRKHRIGTYALLACKWKKPAGRAKLAANFEEACRGSR